MIGLITEDLFFASKVKQVATDHGTTVELQRQPSPPFAWKQTPRVVVIDLELAQSLVASIVNATRAEFPEASIVAFAGHALVDLLSAARQAGCDHVVTRGQLEPTVVSLLLT